MTTKSFHIDQIQTEFELLQPGDLFTIIRNDKTYEDSVFMKVKIYQDEPKPFVETQVFGKSIKTISTSLIVNTKTGALQEYEPQKDDTVMHVIDGHISISA